MTFNGVVTPGLDQQPDLGLLHAVYLYHPHATFSQLVALLSESLTVDLSWQQLF